MEIGRKHTKSVQQYRHNIKLLKYYLKKEKRINETLKYKHMKNQARDKNPQNVSNQKPKERIYSMINTVSKLNKRLKHLGLTLGDIFRMADSNYEGQINKEQFTKTILRLRAQIQESLINQMFYAIDTNLNGILDQDQYLQFLCAFGGADHKEAHKFQRQTLQKFNDQLKKKGISPQNFLKDSLDPIGVYDFKKKLSQFKLNENQAMILLKSFDPQNQGKISHQLFIEQMKSVKQKDKQTADNQKMQKDIKQMCVIWRQQKVNPIKIFQQADVDKVDGVTPAQLQSAFKKLMPGQTSFQIQKWVGFINLNNDKQITREQFVNSIRSFYALNQLQKFSTDYEKQNPNAKRAINNQQPSIEKIIKQLEEKIVDMKMTNKQAFKSIDINGNGTLQKQQIVQGLKKMGMNLVFIGRVLSVFDRNCSGDIQLTQWLKILGQDVQMEEVDAPSVNISDSQLDEQKDARTAKVVKNTLKPLTQNKNKKPLPSKQKQTAKKAKNNETNQSTKPSLKQNPKKNENKKNEPANNSNKKPVATSNNKKFLDEESQLIQQKKQQPKIKKDSSKKTISTKNNIVDTKKSQPQKSAVKKVKQQTSIKKIKQESPKKQTNTKKIKQESPQKNNRNSKNSIQENYDDNFEENQTVDTEQITKKIAVQYKKYPKSTLTIFQKLDRKNKKVLLLNDFKSALSQINSLELNDQQKTALFQQNISDGTGVKYKDWLDQIAQRYAQDVKKQEKDDQTQPQIKIKKTQSTTNSKTTSNKLIKNEQKNQQKPQKRGIKQPTTNIPSKKLIEQSKQNIKQFEQVLTFISKSGQYVQSGHKLSSCIESQTQIQKLQKQYLPKAQQLKKSKKKYKDLNFDTCKNSLSGFPSTTKISNLGSLTWKHYSQIFKKPQLFQGSIQPNDIKQGGLGNCYFLSALSCLAQYSKLIQRLFQYYDLETGYFLVWLCIDGVWTIIQLDGYIVCDPPGTWPAFSRSDKQQLWVILLQKAYAKAYQSYQRIVGGVPSEAIKDLTGSPGQIFDHKNKNCSSDEIWKKLTEANINQFIMTAGTEQGKQDLKIQGHQEGVTKDGIVLGHAYSILDVQQINRQKIVQLRNPWGKIQWNGDWSDSSKKWTEQLRKKYNYYSNQQDGIFWMPFQAYYKTYATTSINYLRPTYVYSSIPEEDVKSVIVKIHSNQFKQGYVTICQQDNRFKNQPPGSPYILTNIISLACKQGKVVRKIQEGNYRYQRQSKVLIKDLKQDQEAIVIATLEQATDINITFYRNCQDNLQLLDEDPLKYFEGLAFLQQPKGDKKEDFSYWMFGVGGHAFLCFKNKTNVTKQYMIQTPKPNNLQILPPQRKDKNKLSIKKGQIQSLRARIIDRSKSFGFGQMSIQEQKGR